MATVIEQRKCLRCGHEWWPSRPGRPVLCPHCKSAYHDVPKPNGKEEPKLEQA